MTAKDRKIADLESRLATTEAARRCERKRSDDAENVIKALKRMIEANYPSP